MVQRDSHYTELYAVRWEYSDTKEMGLSLSTSREHNVNVFAVTDKALSLFAESYSWKVIETAFDRRFFDYEACIDSLKRCVANVGNPEIQRTEKADEFVECAVDFFRTYWDSLELPEVVK